MAQKSRGEQVSCDCERNKPGEPAGEAPCLCSENTWFPQGYMIPDTYYCPKCAANNHVW